MFDAKLENETWLLDNVFCHLFGLLYLFRIASFEITYLCWKHRNTFASVPWLFLKAFPQRHSSTLFTYLKFNSQKRESDCVFELKYKPQPKSIVWQNILIGRFEQSSGCKWHTILCLKDTLSIRGYYRQLINKEVFLSC